MNLLDIQGYIKLIVYEHKGSFKCSYWYPCHNHYFGIFYQKPKFFVTPFKHCVAFDSDIHISEHQGLFSIFVLIIKGVSKLPADDEGCFSCQFWKSGLL